MALFKLCRGAEDNLPTTKTDGYAYFCTNTGSFYIDHKNASGTLVRSKISANYADKLRYVKDGATIEINAAEVLTSSNAIATIGAATTSKTGFMSTADKTKLDGIEANANKYTHPAYTARTGVPTANQTPAFGGTFNVTQPVSDATGHITAMNSKTITIPSTTASSSAAGLMSKEDKSKLDGIATGAEKNIVYVGPTAPTDPNIKVWINTSEEGTGVVPVLPRITTITLTTSGWSGSASPYSQTVAIPTVTTSTKIDLLPTVSQIVSLQNDDIALMAENDGNGKVSIYSFGGKPSSDMTMQVQLTEVAFV